VAKRLDGSTVDGGVGKANKPDDRHALRALRLAERGARRGQDRATQRTDEIATLHPTSQRWAKHPRPYPAGPMRWRQSPVLPLPAEPATQTMPVVSDWAIEQRQEDAGDNERKRQQQRAGNDQERQRHDAAEDEQ